MKDKKTIKNILIGLVIAIIALVAYSIFSSKTGTKKITQNSGLSSKLDSQTLGQIKESDTTVMNSKILKILGSIQNIELKDDIFANPVFRKLKDKNFVVTLPARIGRENPFLPIGYDSLSQENVSEKNNIINTFISTENGNASFFDTQNSIDTDNTGNNENGLTQDNQTHSN